MVNKHPLARNEALKCTVKCANSIRVNRKRDFKELYKEKNVDYVSASIWDKLTSNNKTFRDKSAKIHSLVGFIKLC